MLCVGDHVVVEHAKHGFFSATILELKPTKNIVLVQWDSRQWKDEWVPTILIMPSDTKRNKRPTDRFSPSDVPTSAGTSSPRKKSKTTRPAAPALALGPNFSYLGIRQSSPYDVGSLILFGRTSQKQLAYVGKRFHRSSGYCRDILLPDNADGFFLVDMAIEGQYDLKNPVVPSFESATFGEVGYCFPKCWDFTPPGKKKKKKISCWFTAVVVRSLDGGNDFLVTFPFDLSNEMMTRAEILSCEDEFQRTVTLHKVSPVPSVFEVNPFPMYPTPSYKVKD